MGDTNGLIILDRATQMLAEVRSVDDARDLIDLAEAARVYARQVNLGLEAQNHATEIKLRAQRRAGEILQSMEKNTGAMGIGSNQFEVRLQPTTAPPTYSDLGIDKRDAHIWQTLAAMPGALIKFSRKITCIIFTFALQCLYGQREQKSYTGNTH